MESLCPFWDPASSIRETTQAYIGLEQFAAYDILFLYMHILIFSWPPFPLTFVKVKLINLVLRDRY